MSNHHAIKDTFLGSLERCLASETFIPTFYDRFLSKSPSVRAKFARTDMASQGQKLSKSLRMLASAVAGEAEGLHELSERAETHGRRHLNITPDMYELWSSALLSTACEHDASWTPETEAAWTHTVQLVVDYMIKRA